MFRWFLCCCALLVACFAAPAHAALPALLLDGRAEQPLWPSVRLLADPAHELTAAAAFEQLDRFAVPAGTPGNLGRSAATVWLHLRLQVAGDEAIDRVLQADYPQLNQVDVTVRHAGRITQHHRAGTMVPLAVRALPGRAPAALLRLQPGLNDVLVRVRTETSMVLPLRLLTPVAFAAAESREHWVLGLMVGLSLCMLLYSLWNWASLRDTVFGTYGVMVASDVVYFLAYFGIVQLYFWPAHAVWAPQVAPLAIVLATWGGGRFASAALRLREIMPRVDACLRGCGAAAAVVFAAGACGLLTYGTLQTAATALGMTTTALTLPGAWSRVRRGEPGALYLLLGWSIFALGAVSVGLLLRGFIEPTPWVQHFLPLATVIEMGLWMGMLGMRVHHIHRNADRARLESDTLRAMAHTDALTGLPNRRGLQARLATALPLAQPQALLAVYLLDLDGFKPVNDRHGHDVGDALLVAVGRRLQQHLRGGDVVARLGGDEFVVLAGGLADEAAARALGEKMLASFDEPFVALGQRCDVGLTIGYALAPHDAASPDISPSVSCTFSATRIAS